MSSSAPSAPPDRVPEHIALIPDGNGRWARERGLPVSEGHRRGAQAVEGFLRVCRDWGVAYATVWGFSTENWARSRGEIDAIMRLVGIYLRRNRKRFARDGMRFRHIGRRDRLAREYPKLAELFTDLETETSDYRPHTLNLALDYGGRDEVLRAVRSLIEAGTPAAEIDWRTFSAALDTAGQPDPDLVLRSSGEQRLSGILPMQAVYAELYFSPKLLPDMAEEDFREAIRAFARRERRFGARQRSGGRASEADATEVGTRRGQRG
ncbi:MAG: di-trans,poly-cis-decaprenylcistransferase [Candidatus Eisenbacteria bacterium]|nr:di-trans,poly-cis-decaprenylcistransferase [Candidatus Eisenbacteria bacterium]